jgi:hypothetical protein
VSNGARRRARLPFIVRLAVVLGLVLAAVAACGLGAAPTPFVPRPDLIRMDQADVFLVDPLGLTEGIAPLPPGLEGPFQNGIETVPGDSRAVIVPWTGGDCDVRATVSLRQLGGAVAISVQTVSQPPQGVLCTLGGRLNAVVVRFKEDPPPLTLER